MKQIRVLVIAEIGVNHNGKYSNAIKLIEYLTSEEAQEVYVNNSYEYPANSLVEPSDIVKSWGNFKIDKLNLNALGEYRPEALKIFDKTGWK